MPVFLCLWSSHPHVNSFTGVSPLLPAAKKSVDEEAQVPDTAQPRNWTRGELIGKGAFGQVCSAQKISYE